MNKAHDIHTCKCGDCIGELQLFYQTLSETIAMNRLTSFVDSLRKAKVIADEMSIKQNIIPFKIPAKYEKYL